MAKQKKTIRLINAEEDVKDLGEWIELEIEDDDGKSTTVFKALSSYKPVKGEPKPTKHHFVLGSKLDVAPAAEAARKKIKGPKPPTADVPVALFEHIKANHPALKWWLDERKVIAEAA